MQWAGSAPSAVSEEGSAVRMLFAVASLQHVRRSVRVTARNKRQAEDAGFRQGPERSTVVAETYSRTCHHSLLSTPHTMVAGKVLA